MEWLQSALKAMLHSITESISGITAVLISSFVAIKGIFSAFVFITLPIFIYNLVMEIMIEIIEFGYGLMIETLPEESVTIQISGLAGWMATEIYLVQAVTIYLSFVAIAFVIRFIPFIK
jgi:hypothetical protein